MVEKYALERRRVHHFTLPLEFAHHVEKPMAHGALRVLGVLRGAARAQPVIEREEQLDAPRKRVREQHLDRVLNL